MASTTEHDQAETAAGYQVGDRVRDTKWDGHFAEYQMSPDEVQAETAGTDAPTNRDGASTADDDPDPQNLDRTQQLAADDDTDGQ